jgi:hypothetical protein
MTEKTETQSTPTTDLYPKAAAELQRAEKNLATARKAAADAERQANELRAARDKAQFALATCKQAIAEGTGSIAQLGRLNADAAEADAACAPADETLALLNEAVQNAELAVYRAEQGIRKAMAHDWPARAEAAKALALEVVGPALRAWMRAEYAASFREDQIVSPWQWLRQSDVANALDDAIEQAPDAPTGGLPAEFYGSDALDWRQRNAAQERDRKMRAAA